MQDPCLVSDPGVRMSRGGVDSGAEAGSLALEHFSFVEATTGVRIVEVDDLEPPVIYLREHGLALVSADLSPEAQARAGDAIFQAACGAPLRPAPHG